MCELYKDARVSFVDVAKKLVVSNATIHQRVQKLKLHGILKGFQPIVDEAKLGMTVTSIIGIYLKNAKDCQAVLDKLEKIPEVLEAYYTTGSYALMLKVVTSDIQSFQLFLMEKLQHVARFSRLNLLFAYQNRLVRALSSNVPHEFVQSSIRFYFHK